MCNKTLLFEQMFASTFYYYLHVKKAPKNLVKVYTLSGQILFCVLFNTARKLSSATRTTSSWRSH